jgi:putative Mg2+ transporter-C (MgtC) family protein
MQFAFQLSARMPVAGPCPTIGLIWGRMDEALIILFRIFAALVVGALIGFERTFHGRPAGFRTHALVCIASALLMLVTVYQGEWMTAVPLDAIRTDPTRMPKAL